MPLTDGERAELAAFLSSDTAEHEALVALTPIPLREHSEGTTLRALAVLGMRYVRDRLDWDAVAALGYDQLARQRTESPDEADVATYRRRSMQRLARSDPQ